MDACTVHKQLLRFLLPDKLDVGQSHRMPVIAPGAPAGRVRLDGPGGSQVAQVPGDVAQHLAAPRLVRHRRPVVVDAHGRRGVAITGAANMGLNVEIC